MKVTYRDFGMQKIMNALLRTSAVTVRVGVVGEKAAEKTADGRLTNAENAAIQQYGLGGKHGVARDFLHGPFTNAQAKVSSILRRVMGRIVRLEESPEQAMDWAGAELQKIARDAIFSGVSPRNRASTIAKKGFDHPLVDTLTLYDAISHRVVREGGDVLEAGSSVGDFESFQIGGG